MTARSGTVAGSRTLGEAYPVFNGLRAIVHMLHSVSREAERTLGISGAQLFVLTQLQATPALSIGALAERTLTHQSTVSIVVRRLQRRGLVRKQRAADDGRRVELTLTAAGAALLRRAPVSGQLRLLAALERLPARERRALARGLRHLLRELDIADAPAPLFFERTR